MFKKLVLIGLMLLAKSGFSQQIQIHDLIRYLDAPVQEFELSMLRQGFVCYRSSVSLQQGWTCLFLYQPVPYLSTPNRAAAVIEFIRNTRTNVIVYQLHMAEQYQVMQKELLKAGYRLESATYDRCIYSHDDTIVNCKRADSYNGMSGNYSGYSITLVHRRA